jgi:hypothetical protein
MGKMRMRHHGQHARATLGRGKRDRDNRTDIPAITLIVDNEEKLAASDLVAQEARRKVRSPGLLAASGTLVFRFLSDLRLDDRNMSSMYVMLDERAFDGIACAPLPLAAGAVLPDCRRAGAARQERRGRRHRGGRPGTRGRRFVAREIPRAAVPSRPLRALNRDRASRPRLRRRARSEKRMRFLLAGAAQARQSHRRHARADFAV